MALMDALKRSLVTSCSFSSSGIGSLWCWLAVSIYQVSAHTTGHSTASSLNRHCLRHSSESILLPTSWQCSTRRHGPTSGWTRCVAVGTADRLARPACVHVTIGHPGRRIVQEKPAVWGSTQALLYSSSLQYFFNLAGTGRGQAGAGRARPRLKTGENNSSISTARSFFCAAPVRSTRQMLVGRQQLCFFQRKNYDLPGKGTVNATGKRESRTRKDRKKEWKGISIPVYSAFHYYFPPSIFTRTVHINTHQKPTQTPYKNTCMFNVT